MELGTGSTPRDDPSLKDGPIQTPLQAIMQPTMRLRLHQYLLGDQLLREGHSDRDTTVEPMNLNTQNLPPDDDQTIGRNDADRTQRDQHSPAPLNMEARKLEDHREFLDYASDVNHPREDVRIKIELTEIRNYRV
ncbi:hypothetical protein N7478_011910 [Penicillium angulare]|uniref:uncharacterized protein n=1 Tax=Penicillium angulare TaxID=116970 RepID=UPI0025400644|nr:uncharacterized protein N7478_011910 [Penicillium angulare]KAJ5261315.1 hypothetical protein N7478_011910 [Penicillium angulare]